MKGGKKGIKERDKKRMQ